MEAAGAAEEEGLALGVEHMASFGAHAAKWEAKLDQMRKGNQGAIGAIERALVNEQHLPRITQASLSP